MKFLGFLFSLPLFGASLVIDSGSPTDQFFTGGVSYTILTPGASGDLTERFGTFGYHIPQPAGVYIVNLNFRETGTVSAAGARRFSVSLNGMLVLDRFDLFAVAGLAPLQKQYAVISAGFIDINFIYQVKSAIVSSIEIQPTNQSTNPGTGPLVTSWSSCKSGLVFAGPVGPGVPSPAAVWPGLYVAGWPQPALAETDGTPRAWFCDGLQAYTIQSPNGSTDSYIAVKMPANFNLDPSLWVKQ